jgi:AmmeMemoRadiSam system protein B
MMADDFPRLRYLEAIPVKRAGQEMIALRDPTQISDATLLITPSFYSLLPLFNGENSILDIQAFLTRQTGQLVFREHIDRIVEQFDNAYFLENKNFRELKNRIASSFKKAKLRTSLLAGQSYPKDAADLVSLIDSFYLDSSGAGLPSQKSEKRIRALAAPHIDLRLGGPVYTHAYRALAETRANDTFLILGIGHMGLPDSFSICTKDFETPLGTAKVDLSFINSLRSRLDQPRFEEDLSHRTEHSIEFQIVFLQHLYKNRPFTIVPILTSFSHHDLLGSSESRVKVNVDRFVRAVKAAEMELGKTVTVLASVDLAHIGPRYGDSFTPSDSTVQTVLTKDREAMDFLVRIDSAGFLDYISREEDKRRTCGFPALFTLLQLLENETGRLLSHGFSQMDETRSFVTFASLAWYSQTPTEEN